MDFHGSRPPTWISSCLLAVFLVVAGLTSGGLSASAAVAQEPDSSDPAEPDPAEPDHVEFSFDVVGGYVISPTAYPWVVSGYCGGTLIEPQWVISAAHCGNRTGSTYLIGGDESRTVSEFFGFTDPYDGDYADIALWKLDQPSTKTPLPRSSDMSLDAPGVDVQGLGYGDTEFGGGGADGQLRSTGWVSIVQDAPRDWAFEFGDRSGTTCFGDSGGPVVRDLNPPNGDLLLVGVVSYTVRDQAGVTCTGRAGAAKVANQALWIDATINANGGPGAGAPGALNPTPAPTPPPAPTPVPTPTPVPEPTTPPTVDHACEGDRGVITVTMHNTSTSFVTHTVTVGAAGRTIAVPGGASQSLVFDDLASSTYRVLVQVATSVAYDQALTLTCTVPLPADTIDLAAVMHATSCLGSNGRHDVMAVNLGTDSARYRVEFGDLPGREFSVDAGDWGRLATTGRPDGTYTVVVRRDGVVISDDDVTISCDTPTPTVGPEQIQVINSCRDGFGYVLFQFVNPAPAAASYVIEFENVQNRSTTAQAFGASLRAVTGRPPGQYEARVRDGAETVASLTVDIDCS